MAPKRRIVAREKKENREVWTVEGLVHPGLKRTQFTFKQGCVVRSGTCSTNIPIARLNGTTSGWAKSGVISMRSSAPGHWYRGSRDTDSEVIQTLVGYQWTGRDHHARAVLFLREHGRTLFRTISVDYKAL